MGVQINLRVHEGAGKLLNAVRRAAFRQLVSEVLGLVIRYFHPTVLTRFVFWWLRQLKLISRTHF